MKILGQLLVTCLHQYMKNCVLIIKKFIYLTDKSNTYTINYLTKSTTLIRNIIETLTCLYMTSKTYV